MNGTIIIRLAWNRNFTDNGWTQLDRNSPSDADPAAGPVRMVVFLDRQRHGLFRQPPRFPAARPGPQLLPRQPRHFRGRTPGRPPCIISALAYVQCTRWQASTDRLVQPHTARFNVQAWSGNRRLLAVLGRPPCHAGCLVRDHSAPPARGDHNLRVFTIEAMVIGAVLVCCVGLRRLIGLDRIKQR